MEIEKYLEKFYDQLELQFQDSIKSLENDPKTASILRKSKYSVFYTNPFRTLKEGPAYYLGLNPGGSEGEHYEDETLATLKKRVDTIPNWCEFTTERWKHRNQGSFAAGQAPFQTRTKEVLEFILGEIGVVLANVENVFCTNLFFFRSLNAKVLQKYINSNFLEYHQRCHDEFLNLVKPRVVICNGNGETFSPFSIQRENFRTKSTQAKPTPLFGTFSLKWFCIDNPDWRQERVLVIGLPHLSRYGDIERLKAGLKIILPEWKEI